MEIPELCLKIFDSRRWCSKVAASAFFMRLRQLSVYLGFILQVLLQVLIILSGNYNFFNLLTLALCLSLLDDQHVHFWLRKRSIGSDSGISCFFCRPICCFEDPGFASVTSHLFTSLFRLRLLVVALLPVGVGGVVSADCGNYFVLRHAAGYD